MKRTAKWTLAVALIIVMALSWALSFQPALAGNPEPATIPANWESSSAQQQDPDGDKLVIGNSFVLEEGEVLEGNLFVLGGAARLLEGSTVEGDVAVLGGTLQIDGVVEGEVNAIGGLVTIGGPARVGGDVNTVSAKLDLDENAEIEGQVNDVPAGPFSLVAPGSFKLPSWEGAPPITLPGDVPAPVVNVGLNPLWDALWWIFRSFFWAALALLVALFTPKPIKRVAETAVSNTLVSGGLGCITILIVPLLLILLAITICGIPVSLIGALVIWIGWVFGIITLGAETGRRLSQFLKIDWALPVAAGIGTFLLTLVSNGIELLVPCVGWFVPALIGVIGLGAVLLTRFGSQSYPAGPRSEVDDRPLPSPSPPPALDASVETSVEDARSEE